MTTGSTCSAVPTTRHPKKRDPRIPIEGGPDEDVARVRLGSYEFKKKGVSRFDLRDPYHLAVALTWPQFLAALLALRLVEEQDARCVGDVVRDAVSSWARGLGVKAGREVDRQRPGTLIATRLRGV
jgi:hypothetical protein